MASDPSMPLRRNVTPARGVAVRGDASAERADRLATEEPMEIRVGGPRQEPGAVAITMRTPGGDFELAAGFLFTEGLIRADELQQVSYCELPAAEQQFNVVTVRLNRPFDSGSVRRNFYSSSSCGICGKAALEDVEVHCAPVSPGPVVARDLFADLPEKLREG